MANRVIKFATRRNLIYPLQYLIYNVLRDTESTLVDKYFNYSDSLMFTPLMFIGEFFSGLIVYYKQKKFVHKSLFNDNNSDKYMNLELIKGETIYHSKKIDRIPKMIFILFCCAFFDFVQFILSINTPQFINVSKSIRSRLGGIVIVFNALFYYFVLKLPVLRHQSLSLIINGICLLIVYITEFIFQETNFFLSYGQFVIILLLSSIGLFFNSMIDSNEKYLYEYNNMNPFYSLVFEGFFGFLFSLIYDLYHNPFEKINEFKKSHNTSEFVILIFCLILYVILSGLKNLLRVNTTKIFTPMTTTSVEYILNPIYFIIDFALGEDFLTSGKRNYAYFIINLIIGIIISFSNLIFNEFLILFFCDLDKDTHLEISKRSEHDEDFIQLENMNNNNDDNSET